LSEARYEFEIVPPDESVEQGLCSKCSPAELVAEHAFHKAKAVAEQVESGWILAADTVGECDGQSLGKPVDVDHARQMLEMMSGKKHRVLTGVCLWHRPSDQRIVHVESTSLSMDVIDDAWLNEYLESDQWIGKAGAFGYQDGLDWIRIDEGSESNVVGLPMEVLDGLISKLQSKIDEHNRD
jgi:septum formation protein